jgi:hypothetical protein
VVRTIDAGASIGCAMRLADYRADTLGIPLSPVSFVTTADLARLEDWAASDQRAPPPPPGAPATMSFCHAALRTHP